MQDPGPSSEGRYSVAVGPGDVILFSRNCGKMYPFPAMLCYCAKLGKIQIASNVSWVSFTIRVGSWSDWDHVGIVVPYDEEPSLGSLRRRRLGLLEINIGGVTLRPLRERIERSSSHRIAIRKLVSPPAAGLSEASAMEDKLRGAAARLMKMQYNESSLALSNSMLLSHLSHGM